MSVGPTGIPASIAGSPFAQTQGADVDRMQQESASQTRSTQSAQRAENAASIGETEQDHEASDRDADGRRPWEFHRGDQSAAVDASPDELNTDHELPRSRDATGQRGSHLDVSG